MSLHFSFSQKVKEENEKIKKQEEKALKKKEKKPTSQKGKAEEEGGVIDNLFNSIKAGNFRLRRVGNTEEITA